MSNNQNVDQAEITRFNELAASWWDISGQSAALHRINPLRVAWLKSISGDLQGKSIVDIGCGGGILSEALAKEGALVTGIDLAEKALQVAKLHLLESGQKVTYKHIAAEDFADEMPAQFDFVSCMEMLEHVPNPASVIKACAKLVKPDGLVFFSTINRTLKAGALVIGAAEYALKLIPKGTHSFSRFIKPAELAQMARISGLTPKEASGFFYDPWQKTARLSDDFAMNYLWCAKKVL